MPPIPLPLCQRCLRCRSTLSAADDRAGAAVHANGACMHDDITDQCAGAGCEGMIRTKGKSGGMRACAQATAVTILAPCLAMPPASDLGPTMKPMMFCRNSSGTPRCPHSCTKCAPACTCAAAARRRTAHNLALPVTRFCSTCYALPERKQRCMQAPFASGRPGCITVRHAPMR